MAQPIGNKELTVRTLKKRKDFLRVAKQDKKWISPAMIIQLSTMPDAIEQTDIRVGYTASKKVGNAVLRNKAKRRLREVVKQVMKAEGRKNHDYVIIAREPAVRYPFNEMIRDMKWCLKRLHNRNDNKKGAI